MDLLLISCIVSFLASVGLGLALLANWLEERREIRDDAAHAKARAMTQKPLTKKGR